MTKILCLDASTEACSVALMAGDETLDRFQLAPRKHASLILPQVRELLAEASLTLGRLDAIACNIGPGAFTGIRIAVSIAQGLAFGADLPTIGLTSLNNLAFMGAAESSTGVREWLCAIDARMDEVYLAGYRIKSDSDSDTLFEPVVISPEKVNWQALSEQFDLSKAGLIGSGWQAYQERLFNESSGLKLSNLLPERFPNALYGLSQAKQLFLKGEYETPEKLQPLYLRNQVAEKQKPK